MKQLIMQPDGWPRCLGECSPGYFVYEGQLCFKSEYSAEMQIYNSAGECFCGKERDSLIVQPVVPEWIEVDV